MCLGLSVGTAIGAATRSMGTWMPLGMSLGLLYGLMFGQRSAKSEEEKETREADVKEPGHPLYPRYLYKRADHTLCHGRGQVQLQ